MLDVRDIKNTKWINCCHFITNIMHNIWVTDKIVDVAIWNRSKDLRNMLGILQKYNVDGRYDFMYDILDIHSRGECTNFGKTTYYGSAILGRTTDCNYRFAAGEAMLLYSTQNSDNFKNDLIVGKISMPWSFLVFGDCRGLIIDKDSDCLSFVDNWIKYMDTFFTDRLIILNACVKYGFGCPITANKVHNGIEITWVIDDSSDGAVDYPLAEKKLESFGGVRINETEYETELYTRGTRTIKELTLTIKDGYSFECFCKMLLSE